MATPASQPRTRARRISAGGGRSQRLAPVESEQAQEGPDPQDHEQLGETAHHPVRLEGEPAGLQQRRSQGRRGAGRRAGTRRRVPSTACAYPVSVVTAQSTSNGRAEAACYHRHRMRCPISTTSSRRPDRAVPTRKARRQPPPGTRRADRPDRDRHFQDLPDYLRPGDLLVFNDTRVIRRGSTASRTPGSGGGPHRTPARPTRHWPRCGRASRRDPVGRYGRGGLTAVIDRRGRCTSSSWRRATCRPFWTATATFPCRPTSSGRTSRGPGALSDGLRRAAGCGGRPDGGLHFDQAMLDRLAAQGVRFGRVTLHVGAGTFQPVRSDRLTSTSCMPSRSSWRRVCALAADTRRGGGRIVAVGTTAVRSLETAAPTARCGRIAATPACSSGPATASGAWTSCSPIFTSRSRRCSCSSARSRASSR